MTALALEPYVTARELAELMHVSLSTIRRWTAEGMPSETWGMGHTRRYLPTQCITWARARADTFDNTPRRFTAASRKD
jgi:phage terminase Nu1 subunit (DNA packaging protein)